MRGGSWLFAGGGSWPFAGAVGCVGGVGCVMSGRVAGSWRGL